MKRVFFLVSLLMFYYLILFSHLIITFVCFNTFNKYSTRKSSKDIQIYRSDCSPNYIRCTKLRYYNFVCMINVSVLPGSEWNESVWKLWVWVWSIAVPTPTPKNLSNININTSWPYGSNSVVFLFFGQSENFSNTFIFLCSTWMFEIRVWVWVWVCWFLDPHPHPELS